jgi:hypothetical protein
MQRRHLFTVCLAAVALLLTAPSGAMAKSCNISGKERKLGPTYVTSLSVTGVGCGTGEQLVKAYHRCRFASGGKKGRCTRKVSGYRCSERRGKAIPTQFDARVTCTRGSKKVTHAYTQFT